MKLNARMSRGPIKTSLELSDPARRLIPSATSASSFDTVDPTLPATEPIAVAEDGDLCSDCPGLSADEYGARVRIQPEHSTGSHLRSDRVSGIRSGGFILVIGAALSA